MPSTRFSGEASAPAPCRTMLTIVPSQSACSSVSKCRFLLGVEPGLLARRDGGGGAAEDELDVAVRERLRLEPGGAPDPGERVPALAQAVAQPGGGRRQRLARRGLPAEVAEGAGEDRRRLAVCFVPRLEERLRVLVEVDVRLVGRRRLTAHAGNLLRRRRCVRPRREDVGVIALHAVWSRDSQLCVWGEDSALPGRAPRRRGRRPAKPRPREHPFACSAEAVAGALAVLGVALGADAPEVERQLYLLLPSFEDGPQHSPQLLPADGDRHPGKPELLHPWVVPAIALGPEAALEVLLALPPSPPPGLALGDSLRFLAEAGKLALELVARGRVLPGLTWRDERWLASWRPVTTDPDDEERVRMLVAAMPPLLRAELFFSEEGNAPEAVLGDLLGAVVDACARSFLADGLGGRRSRRGSPRTIPLAEAWLAALTGADPVVEADALQLAALAERLEEWRRAGERYAAHRTFRTCFRLSEPDELGAAAAAPWRVEFVLQAKDDPSLLVPAAEVWSSNGSGLRALGRRIADPQERLLGGLGHAVRLWPELEPALREAAPTGLDLTQEAAIGFLRDAAPALEQAGFGVLAPQWWKERLRLRLEAEPFEELEEGGGLFGLEGLCAYEWKIAVGDATLSLAGAARARGAEAAAGDGSRALDRPARRRTSRRRSHSSSGGQSGARRRRASCSARASASAPARRPICRSPRSRPAAG